MSDAASLALIPLLAQTPGPCLWVADENSHSSLSQLVPFRNQLHLVTHRIDTHETALRLGLNSRLCSDFWADVPVQACFFRIFKEKPLVHYIINQARQHLPLHGQLVLAGHKTEGIKTYCEKTAQLFLQSQKAQKQGDTYLGQFTQPAQPAQQLLPTQDYPALRPVLTLNGRSVYSRPGLYGWDKLDLGSQLLIDTFLQHAQSKAYEASLDLGCGYGYLTLAFAHLPIGQRVATDNNLLATEAMQANAQAFGLAVDVLTADCAQGIQQRFDLILCNPPFHKGFHTQGDLTQLFLERAHQRLAPKGEAWFVVNSFIGIENKARALFKHGEVLAHTPHFKVLRCWH